MDFVENYLSNVKFEFSRYKTLGDNTFAQLNIEELHWKYSTDSNSISIVVKHIVGNMLSRWTNFLTEDGEKSWRNREQEFKNPPETKKELLELWEKGWACLFEALESINPSNIDTKINIRGEAHTILEAINRQLAHYSSHVGQIVMLGKMLKGAEWESLSIPKGESQQFNKRMFDENS